MNKILYTIGIFFLVGCNINESARQDSYERLAGIFENIDTATLMYYDTVISYQRYQFIVNPGASETYTLKNGEFKNQILPDYWDQIGRPEFVDVVGDGKLDLVFTTNTNGGRVSEPIIELYIFRNAFEENQASQVFHQTLEAIYYGHNEDLEENGVVDTTYYVEYEIEDKTVKLKGIFDGDKQIKSFSWRGGALKEL